MIKFDSSEVQIYNNNFLIPIPKGTSLETIEKAKQSGKPLHIQIDVIKEKRKRSLSANAFCWVLCQQIAEEMSKNGPLVKKEDVYRHAIMELFSPVSTPIKNEDVKEMKDAWESRGIGWMCVDTGEQILYGYTRMEFYVGSSQFDTAKMSRLIDGLVQDAEALDLDILSETERNKLLDNWEKDRKKE